MYSNLMLNMTGHDHFRDNKQHVAYFWFASASLANPYCQSMWMSVCMYWFASASLANPYCQSMWMCVCMSVCVSEFLRSNISETKGARGSVTMGSL